METFLEPQNALRTAWLWIVQSGPNRGQALPVSPGTFGRLSGFDDPAISRQNLEIRRLGNTLHAAPLPDAAPVYNLWKTLGIRRKIRRSKRLKPGRKLKMGTTKLLIRPRPTDLRLTPPPDSKPGSQRWILFMLLPLVFMLALGVFIGWRILFVLGVLAVVALVWLLRRASQVPRAEHLWLAAATPVRQSAKKTETLRVFTGNRWCRRFLDLPAGENLCLTGPGSEGFAYWLVAQALIFGQGYLSPDNPAPWKGCKARHDEDLLEIRVMAPHEIPNCTPRQVAITITPTPPAWTQRILTVKAHQGRLGSAWFTSLKAAWERNPATLELNPAQPGHDLPRQVSRDILGATDTISIITNWQTEKTGLTTPLGVTTGETTWELNLVEEGPHALVAGTTGAGKSELLTSWLVGLALRYSPSDLRFILIDYKGGAAFGELAGLPHVHGVLTDLQPTETRRALLSLEAFLRRREAILATVHARDITHYRDITGKGLGRVMIVVDEFRALATDHAELMENLIRLATHGRSLGLHLVLATQKPGGIVNAQILANTNLRLALRMRTGADSNDILGDGRAAQLPAIPGRLYWEGQSEGLAQAAWCGADSWVGEVVQQLRDAWEEYSNLPPAPPDSAKHPEIASSPVAPDSPGSAPAKTALPEIWLPEMPSEILAPPTSFALTDWPRHAVQEWRSPQGLLGIFGNPGTGRSTALLTLAVNELNRKTDTQVVVVSPTPELFDAWAGKSEGRMVVLRPTELWRLDKLRRLLAEGQLAGALVLLDRADLIVESLDRISPGSGIKALEAILGGAGMGGYRLAFSAPLSAGRCSWGTLAAERFVLTPRDTVDLHTAGVEAFASRVSLHEVLPGIITPGRGVWQAAGNCVEAQIGQAPVLEKTQKATPQAPFYQVFTDSTCLAKRLPHLPQELKSSEIPSSEGLITLGWASERSDWARFTPHRYWQIEESNVMRGLISQLKREYRRLGYQILDLKDLEPERKEGKILVITSKFEQNDPKLKNRWESLENSEGFVITILELFPSGTLPQNLATFGNFFAKPKTRILALDKTTESRHRLASTLHLDLETARKLQVTTDYPAIFQDENGVSPLLFPSAKVKHIT